MSNNTVQNTEPQTPNSLLDSIDLEEIVAIAKSAGDAIMEIYNKDFKVEYKDDKSPLTEADLKSNEIICNALNALNPTSNIQHSIIFPFSQKKEKKSLIQKEKIGNTIGVLILLMGLKSLSRRMVSLQ